MKHRHIINLLWIAIPICVILRTIQHVFTIDSTTGFIKQPYIEISSLITLVVLAAVAAMYVLAYFADGVSKKQNDLRPILAFTCTLTGGIFVFETVSSLASLDSWYSILLVILSLLSAFVFIAFGLKNIYPYNFPTVLLVIPALYYIVKLITLFISTSALSLVTENIFLLFTNSAMLWFLFEFASFENQIGDSIKSHKKIFACGITAVMLCVISALPKLLLLAFFNAKASSGDVSASLLMLSQAIFILSYIVGIFYKKDKSSARPASKHSA